MSELRIGLVVEGPTDAIVRSRLGWRVLVVPANGGWRISLLGAASNAGP